MAVRDECEEWKRIAIDERANRIAGIPVSHLKDKYKQNAYLEQAAKELNRQATQPDDDNLTIAYMLGGKKADDRLKVLQGYVERLEAAYIADSMQSEELARVALDRIREGK